MNTDNTQDGAEPSPAFAGSRGGILDEAREWLARSRAAKPLPSERIIASLLVHATLTDEELEALDYMLRHAAWAASEGAFADSGDYRLHHDAVFRIMGRTKETREYERRK